VISLSKSRESFWLSAGGGAGIVTPLFAFTFIALSIATYPQFSWFNNALSDLGVVSGITATLFNFGLYASGLMSLWFAISLYKFLSKNFLGKTGAIAFGAVSLALEGIGVAPEGTNAFNFPWHYFFSVAFFTLMPISMLVIAGYFLTTRQRGLSFFTLLTTLVAAAPWVLYFLVQYVPDVAIPELVSALAGSAWAIVIGWKMLKQSSTNTSS
jgi:hypothetical membrane protein